MLQEEVLKLFDAVCRGDLESEHSSVECEYNHFSTLKQLLSDGVKLSTNLSSPIVLEAACEHGHLNLVKYLVTSHLHFYKLLNALEVACKRGHLEVVKFLVSSGLYELNFLCMQRALENGHLEVVKYIVSLEGDVYIKSPKGTCKPFFIEICARNGNLEMLKYLASFGVDLLDINVYVLLDAAQNGHLEILKFFFSIGASCEEKFLSLPFELACRNGHLDVVQYLVSFGTLKIVDNWNIALQLASDKNRFEVMKFLLSNGATDSSIVSERYNAYIAFCEKMKEKIRHRAAKKIYYWIIPKLYAPDSVSAYNLGMKGYQECFGNCMN